MFPSSSFGSSTPLNASNGFGRNGVPVLERNNATFALGDAAQSQAYHATVRIDGDSASGGLVVYDYAAGVLRPLILFYYFSGSANGTMGVGRIVYRQLDQAHDDPTKPATMGMPVILSTTTFTTTPGAGAIHTADLYMWRDTVSAEWYLHYRNAGQEFATLQARIVEDDEYGGGMHTPSQLYVGLFADNSGAADRVVSFERFAAYPEAVWAAYASNLSGAIARNASIAFSGSVCTTMHTVTRVVGPAVRDYKLRKVMGAVKYRVSVSALVRNVGFGPAVYAPGVVTPMPLLPMLSTGMRARPALFLDSVSLPAGGGPLERWRDVSGNGRDFVQPVLAYQPLLPTPTLADQTPSVYFPPASPTEMVMERNEDFWDFLSPNFTDHEMTAFAMYQPEVQSYYSMNLISKGHPGRAGWQMVATYAGSYAYGGFRVYGDNVPFIDFPEPAPEPWTTAERAVGVHRVWPPMDNPDSYTPTLLTYDYWRRDPVLPWFQLDGCVGINRGVVADQCNNPTGDNSIDYDWNAVPSSPSFGKGFVWEGGMGPRFPSIVGSNTVVWNRSLTSSEDRFKISDASWGGRYVTTDYNRNWYQGRLHAIMLFRPRIASRADRQVLQEWLYDRYGQRCFTPWTPPTVASTCSGARMSGTTCIQRCKTGFTRLGGAVVPPGAIGSIHTCANGATTPAPLVCGAVCGPAPLNVSTTYAYSLPQRVLVSEDFSAYPSNVVTAQALWAFGAYPRLPPLKVVDSVRFTGSAMIMETDPGDDCTAPGYIAVQYNNPMWGEAGPQGAVDPVTFSASFMLSSPNVLAGLGIRSTVSSPGTSSLGYRFMLMEGVAVARWTTVYEAGGVITSTYRNVTWTPVPPPMAIGVPYKLSCALTGPNATCALSVQRPAPGGVDGEFVWSQEYTATVGGLTQFPRGTASIVVEGGTAAFLTMETFDSACFPGSTACNGFEDMEFRYMPAPGSPPAALPITMECMRTGTYQISVPDAAANKWTPSLSATPAPYWQTTTTPTGSATRTPVTASTTGSPSRPPSRSQSPGGTRSGTPTRSATPSATKASAVSFRRLGGAYRTYVVPPNVRSLTVHAWGAGGGGGSSVDARGGGGAYVSGTLAVTPGERLRLVVGRGGGWPGSPGGDEDGGGGVGWPSSTGSPATFGGAGGGRSGVQRLVGGTWTEVATAAGGGGGGGWGSTGGAGGLGTGRRGGDQAVTLYFTDNRNASEDAAGATWGGGGGQTSGGIGSFAGARGAFHAGGDASGGTRAGGGGGGHYGGAAGMDGAGGGGSSFTGALEVATGEAGWMHRPGGSTARFYEPGAGVGGPSRASGGDGLVVLVLPAGVRVSPSGSPTRGFTGSRTGSRTRASRSQSRKPKN
jgi:hypothetical protein